MSAVSQKYLAEDFDPDDAGFPASTEALRVWHSRQQVRLERLDRAIRCAALMDQTGQSMKHYRELRGGFEDLGDMLQDQIHNWDKDPFLLQKVMGQQCRHCFESTQIIDKPEDIPVDASGVFACFLPSDPPAEKVEQSPVSLITPSAWQKISPRWLQVIVIGLILDIGLTIANGNGYSVIAKSIIDTVHAYLG